jgi:hypothetical protein
MQHTQILTVYTEIANTSQLLVRPDHNRIGMLILNRSGNTVYISHSEAMALGNSASMRIRPDESIAFLKSEGDDCSRALYLNCGVAGMAVELVESFET